MRIGNIKKLAIIGRGTAGAFAVTHFLRWSNWKIDWYFDPNTPTQAVGEGSNIVFPEALAINIGFKFSDLRELDGSFKIGIQKNNWGKGNNFLHDFPPPKVAMHFNAIKFQNYILSKVKSNSRVKLVEQNVGIDDIDADFIMDCSGKPSDYSEYNIANYIPVNSAYITPCYWDNIEFQHTLTIAGPYGWVFGIPLTNRCSIGYMYNNSISSEEEIKEDVKNIFNEFKLIPSENTASLKFKNYYKKVNFTDRVAYNGNASFFLEPMEATSISTMDYVQRMAYDLWTNKITDTKLTEKNKAYTDAINHIETMIMLHYYAGSIFDNDFWKYAKNRGEESIRSMIKDPLFVEQILLSKNYVYGVNNPGKVFGSWPLYSFNQNLTNLELYDKLEGLINGK